MNNWIIFSTFLIIQLISYNVYCMGHSFYENRKIKKKVKPKVFDIAYKYLPDMSSNKWLEWGIDVLLLIPLIIIIFGGNKNINLYKHYIFSITLVHLIRVIFISSTILPTTKDENNYSVYNLIFGHNYDKIYSGHLATSILTFVFLYKMGIIMNIPFIIGYNFLLSLCLLLNRGHYTVDLLVAVMASYSVYNLSQLIEFN